MQTIHVRTVPEYSVTIAPGLLGCCGQALREIMAPCRMAVVTDSAVAPLYLETVRESLESAGFPVSPYVFSAGEESKNLTTLANILEFLAERRLTRTDCVIALGGGVTGDMAGFAAAVYLRGIRYVQLPTTLLAAVDSSVGGKTAIDLAAGKNLAAPPRPSKPASCATRASSPSLKAARSPRSRRRSSPGASGTRPAWWSGTRRSKESGSS